MRTALVAVLTFLAGLWIGARFFPGVVTESDDPVGAESVADDASHGSPAGSHRDAALAPRGDSPASSGPSLRPPAGSPERATPRIDVPIAWALDRINRDYALYRGQPDAKVPDEFERDAANAAIAYASRLLRGFGGWMARYVDTREVVGLLDDPPRITVQARGTGWISSFARTSSDHAGKLSARPLEMTAPPRSDDAFEAYVEAGVQPLDKALLIERIDVVYHVGYASTDPVNRPWENKGEIRIAVDGYTALDVRNQREGPRHGWLSGLKVLRPPGSLPRIVVTVRRGVAGVVALGRYVPLAEVGELRDEPFHWVPSGDDGLLGDDPVLLQVLANHGGGNDRKVRLDGTTSRVDRPNDSNLWDPYVDFSKLEDSLSWCENAGRVPSGKIFRITRIDWRMRLDVRQGKSSNFLITYDSRKLVERFASDGAEASGTWTGELDVNRGDEGDLEIVCSYFGMGEAVVYGTLVDVSDD